LCQIYEPYFKRTSEAAGRQGAQGERLSLLDGNESLSELKDLLFQLCQECPAKENHLHCPFRTLSGLSNASVERLLKVMPRASCLHLFELELTCRSQGDSPCHSPKRPPADGSGHPPGV
jgi:hypothetical protein